MLNYADLSDVEFEYLCKDIMAKRLNVELRSFASGRDGGVDLTNNVSTFEIVVQIKHYIGSSNSQLVHALRKEVDKVRKLRPKHYYICCSKQLTPAIVKEIFDLFSECMQSDANIVTLTEIDSFLKDPLNMDILRKHYKLWITASGLLNEMHNTSIFVDCEVLLADIERDKQLFVRTSAFDLAVSTLNNTRVLLIVGDPGVGKTITSKMLVLKYAVEGYRVRYTTNSTNLHALKNALTQDRQVREVILLDDCFGQAYFCMRESQENELISLIKFVNLNTSKILILNSRVTIYREAQLRTPMLSVGSSREYNVVTIDMSKISRLDKARIFYNHMYFLKTPPLHFASIKLDKNYLKIIEHRNYNPRIIEFVCSDHQTSTVNPSDFYGFIMSHLGNPVKVWDNEYERRLLPVDRIFVITLFSLTLTVAPVDLVRRCYMERIEGEDGIDTTVDHFSAALDRLQGSFIRTLDFRGCHSLSMLNPSINDFLEAKLANNSAEKQKVLRSALSIKQYYRLVPDSQISKSIMQLFTTHRVLEFIFDTDVEKAMYIAYFIAENTVLDRAYQQHVQLFFDNVYAPVPQYTEFYKSPLYTLEQLLQEPVCSYYEVRRICEDWVNFERLVNAQTIEQTAEVVNILYILWKDEPLLEDMCRKAVFFALEDYLGSVEASDFDSEVEHAAGNFVGDYSLEEDAAIDRCVETLETSIVEHVIGNINDIMDTLPNSVRPSEREIEGIRIYVSGAEEAILSYLSFDDSDRDEDTAISRYQEDKEIEDIFQR